MKLALYYLFVVLFGLAMHAYFCGGGGKGDK